MGGRNRSRTQRKHFKQNRDNVWKRPKSDSEQQQQENNNNAEDNANPNPAWAPLTTQNPAFDEYYKVICKTRILCFAFLALWMCMFELGLSLF